MRKDQLEHLIRAAAEITNEYEIVVVGSQSILGSVESPPAECLISMEADVFPLGNESLSELIDGSIGEGSLFHVNFGYYAQGVDSTTSILPKGWRDRLHRVQSPGTNGRIGYCLDATDLFLAKCAAGRPKDRDFNAALLRHAIVDPVVAQSRIASMPLDDDRKSRLTEMVAKLADEATPATAVPHRVPGKRMP